MATDGAQQLKRPQPPKNSSQRITGYKLYRTDKTGRKTGLASRDLFDMVDDKSKVIQEFCTLLSVQPCARHVRRASNFTIKNCHLDMVIIDRVIKLHAETRLQS